jgi:hypothetical protein
MTAPPADPTGLAICSPLRRPRVARITALVLAVLLSLASLVICAAVGGSGREAARADRPAARVAERSGRRLGAPSTNLTIRRAGAVACFSHPIDFT